MILKLSILTVAAICFAAGTETPNFNKNILLVQKTVYDLLWHVNQPDKVHPEIYKLGTSWDIEANIDLYKNKESVTEFVQRFKYGMLPRGKLFSVYYPELLEEAESLFNIFYYANDVQTFLNTASWARIHMNEEMFVYAFSVAVIHRPDTKNIRLPLPYEIVPNLYFNVDIMQQAYDYKMSLIPHGEGDKVEPQVFYAQLNNTRFVNALRDPEHKLQYYLEDIDLSAFYYHFNQEFPFWMSGKKFGLTTEMRGELYYHIHKTLVNRYCIERLANGLSCRVEDFGWDSPIITGFTPAISFRNGMQFPARKQWSPIPIHNYGFLRMAKQFEARLLQTIDYGFILTPKGQSDKTIYDDKGVNLIANMIEGNADSSNYEYYGSVDHFARAVFGFSPESQGKYDNLPNALEYFSTSMRDPAFYRIYNRVMSYFRRFKEHLPVYTADQLSFKGVELESVAIDKMYTFFDYTDALISNGVNIHDHKDAESIVIKARQPRLNHNEYTYHMTVKSEKEVRASVRIFIGPKKNVYGKDMGICENYENFYEIDYFITDLKAGTNKIERKSSEATFTLSDVDSSDTFYKRMVEAIEKDSPLPVANKLAGFPDRLILPRGSVEGFPVQFFFYVSEFVESSSHNVKSRMLGEWIHDNKPFGFPLDRPVFGFNFTGNNMLFKDASIYHKERSDLNLTI